MNRKWLKRIIAMALVVLFLVGGYFVYRRLQAPKTNANANYMVARAQIGDIELNVSASGTVVAAVSQEVVPLVSGAVEKLEVKEGDRVKEGDVIAVIDDDSLQQEIERIESNLKQQNLSLSKLKASLSDFYIKAPADGRIKFLKARVGEDVGTTTRTYGALAIISTDGKMKVTIKPQGSISLTAGEKVLVRLEDSTEVEGTVVDTSLSQPAGPSGQQDSQAGPITGSVQVQINRDDLPIGAKATVLKRDENSGEYVVIGEGTLDVNQGVSVTGNNGKISVIYVKENSVVKRGDNLFKLDDSDVKANIESQNLAIEQTQKELESKKSQLGNTEVKSPINGIITSLTVKVGDQVQQGKAIATIIDPTQLNVVVAVDELDIPKVKIGQKAKIKVDAFPDTVFEGEVIKIADIGQSSGGGVTTFDVTISIKDPGDVRIGMSATAEIQVESKKGVVLLPIEAVQEKNGEKYVMVASSSSQNTRESEGETAGGSASAPETSGTRGAEGRRFVTRNRSVSIQSRNLVGEISFRKVEIGLTNETYAEVISGVEEGEEVLIPVSNSTSTQNNWQGMFPGFGNMRGAFPQGGFNRSRVPSNTR
ncbi:HlyD family efflux transporter periplasmic adaptor subunit [Caldicoprobacter algeriensis]|uniref:HlyD family efflux transporter periplasmic adaptor subunit n=1 Tax=Caldicoprobacter algeriensis TaxID=699281 RepID=UPI00207A8EA1|nr:HlyD family efflux transporter periplasmic adaptor subunit [Caldicoprobacter algeriensis]MCM8899965.1 HlyD family efflux transporter periplasmic adaptor subunit [Caldicoprobacter algeriensis]